MNNPIWRWVNLQPGNIWPWLRNGPTSRASAKRGGLPNRQRTHNALAMKTPAVAYALTA